MLFIAIKKRFRDFLEGDYGVGGCNANDGACNHLHNAMFFIYDFHCKEGRAYKQYEGSGYIVHGVSYEGDGGDVGDGGCA